MKVTICSRDDMTKLLEQGLAPNTVVISFSDPLEKRTPKEYAPLDFGQYAPQVFPVPLWDIDLEILPQFGLTYDTFFPEVDKVAAFIKKAHDEGKEIVCQCEYGQSRSAACAAAILEYYDHNGISVFADYRYYPNQMVYHKVYDALTVQK